MQAVTRQGQTGAQRAVEAAHLRLYGEARPYYEIAASLQDGRHSLARVALVIFQLYNVAVTSKTVGQWVKRAQEQKAEVTA